MTRPVQIPPTKEEKGSLLAFLYHIRWTKEIHDAFAVPVDTPPDDPRYVEAQKVMEQFGLTAEQSALVNELHPREGQTDAERATAWAKLAACLIPEFYEWTYDDKPPTWW